MNSHIWTTYESFFLQLLSLWLIPQPPTKLSLLSSSSCYPRTYFRRVRILALGKLGDGSMLVLLGLGPWQITVLGLSFHICKLTEMRVWEGKSRVSRHSFPSFLSHVSELSFLNLCWWLSTSAGSSLNTLISTCNISVCGSASSLRLAPSSANLKSVLLNLCTFPYIVSVKVMAFMTLHPWNDC